MNKTHDQPILRAYSYTRELSFFRLYCLSCVLLCLLCIQWSLATRQGEEYMVVAILYEYHIPGGFSIQSANEKSSGYMVVSNGACVGKSNPGPDIGGAA
jgi:hypothetical protein